MAEKFVKPKPEQMLPKPNIKRKRGAQAGNTNALKHGFYSRRFTKLELRHLDVVLSDGLIDEIALSRVLIRRYFYLASKEAKSLEEWGAVLSICGALTARLTNMVRVQSLLSGGKPNNLFSLLLEGGQIVGEEQGYF